MVVNYFMARTVEILFRLAMGEDENVRRNKPRREQKQSIDTARSSGNFRFSISIKG
jgi:hypothetical protein